MRKYTTEFLFHVRAIQYAILRPVDLERISDERWAAAVLPSHIYAVCRRPKITIAPGTTEFTDDAVVGAFRVWHGETYEEVPYRVANLLGTDDVTMVAPYPGSDFEVVGGDGHVHLDGTAAALMTSFGPAFSRHLDLEVLYVGQAFGFEGSRTAKDRLRSHETLQGILGEALARSPDMDIWLVLFGFEDPYIFTEIDPRQPTSTSEAEDDEHIERVTSTPISLQQQVNLTEAMLIRHFDAEYNETFRTSFPNPAHTSYRECYDLDFHSVGVELETEAVGTRLWSRAQPATWLHIPRFPLHSAADRASMFSLFD